MNIKTSIILIWILVAGCLVASAQSDRNLIRQGNRAYHQGKWVEAETQYRKALAKNSQNSQALYNLGCALMAQQKDSAALQQYNQAAQVETNPIRKAKSYHNMGAVLQNHKEYAQAIDAYKMALRNNPHDDETRYNLALCKKLLKNQPQNDKNNKNKDNKNKNQDKQKQQDKQDKNKNKDKDKDQNKQEKSEQERMSKENAEQMLNAAIQEEKSTKQKMQKAMSQPRKKTLEKNW